ncbi:MAG: fibrinogen-like YCDxxxxGGGW domain-containing protein [Myxococcota bacterium]
MRSWVVFLGVCWLTACTDFVSAQAASDGSTGPSASDATGGSGGATASPTSTTSTTADTTTTAATTNTPSDDDAGDTDDTTGVPPLPDVPATCGNGQRDAGEACDDGNDDDADACTILCQPPTCNDGLQSGPETGVDCGGPECTGCAAGNDCNDVGDCADGLVCEETCAFPQSCLEILQADGAAGDGDYQIDPLGDGTLLDVECDMSGGGWTLVFEETFEPFDDQAWTLNDTYDCAGNTILGLFRGNQSPIARTVPLLGVPHVEARLQAEYLVIDSWDNETGRVTLDGTEVFSVQCDLESCGQTGNLCAAGWWDGVLDVEGVVANRGDEVAIAFESTTDQDTNDESFGIDAVRVAVR